MVVTNKILLFFFFKHFAFCVPDIQAILYQQELLNNYLNSFKNGVENDDFSKLMQKIDEMDKQFEYKETIQGPNFPKKNDILPEVFETDKTQDDILNEINAEIAREEYIINAKRNREAMEEMLIIFLIVLFAGAFGGIWCYQAFSRKERRTGEGNTSTRITITNNPHSEDIELPDRNLQGGNAHPQSSIDNNSPETPPPSYEAAILIPAPTAPSYQTLIEI